MAGGRGVPVRSPRWVVSAVLVLALAACGGADEEADDAGSTTKPAEPTTEAAEATTEPAPEVPLEVEVVTETYVDTTRPTAATPHMPEAPDRTIVTRIAHPAEGGPYPLVVLSHGASGHPDEYAETAPDWASDGFVVATPAFPLTNADVPEPLGNAGDHVNQPEDVSFVIDQVLAAAEDPTSPLHGRVDPDAIGLAGHSLGGATTWGASFHTAVGDDRVDSVAIFAGLVLPIPDGELALDSGLPLLVMHGDADDVPMDGSRGAYDAAVAPKWFVTLRGATHVPAFTDDPSPHDALVRRTLLDFWHGTLDGDDAALSRVTADATDPELTVVDHA